MRFWGLVLVAACRYGFDSTDATTTTSSAQLQVSITAPGLMIVNADVRVTFGSIDPNALSDVPPLPGTVAIPVPDVSGTATVTVDAVDNRQRILTATATANMIAGSGGSAMVVLGAGLADACTDGVKDGGETDVDCGASCPACGLGALCFLDADCSTGNCASGLCEATTGPPAWLRVADAPRGRIGAAAVTGMDGRIYVFGGSVDDNTGDYTEVDVYDPVRDLWGSAPALPAARERIAGAIEASGAMYAIGGTTMSGAASAEVDRYVPGDAGWTSVPALPTARGFLAAGLDVNGAIHAIGGTVAAAANAENDQLGASWTAKAPLPAAMSNLTAARTSSGTLIAIGGRNSSGYSKAVVAYDPTANAWTAGPSLATARSDLCSAVGGDGRVYAIGGYVGSPGMTVVEAERPMAPWTAVAPTVIGRDACTATTAPDGRVLVIGGRTVNLGQVEVEAYGPQLRLATASGSAGDTVTIEGKNFGANANVRIHLDTTAVELATTDASGAFTTSIVIPATSVAGVHTIHAGDQKAKFPVAYPFVVE